ncbi:MAG: hypothetical protein Q7U13_14650 [Rhodoferax sp.]|nr:hypothetical protein [Rhodoferax sp.]
MSRPSRRFRGMHYLGSTVKRVALAVIEYALGFVALAVFATLAFGSGKPTDERMIFAFKIGAAIAAFELAFLFWRSAPANRLIIGANLWLFVGGAAAVLEQWWLLKGYQQVGEAGLFVAMLVVGLLTTALSPTGFVGATGERRRVLWSSAALVAAVALGLVAAIHFRGEVKLAAVLPVIALSWLNRLLCRVAANGA